MIGGVFLRPKPMQMPEMVPDAIDDELEVACPDPV